MKDVSNGIVSIIVVAGGSKDYLESCLQSVKKQSYADIEAIVIDNSLNPEFAKDFRKNYPGAIFSSSPKNLFYCEALNKGIQLSKGDFILCLNDDVILGDDFVKEALSGFKVAVKIGMVSGKILRRDAKTIDSAGLFLSPCRSAQESGYGRKDNGDFDKERYVFGVNGAVAFYRREMLELIKIGAEYFDPDFRFFYEDLDVAWRAHNLGWKVFFVPSAVAYHVRGGTARKAKGLNKRFARRFLSDELHFDLVKNRYLAIIKNEALLSFLAHLPFILVYDILAWGFILFFRHRLLRMLFTNQIPLASAFRKRKLLAGLRLK